ncbi:MAG: 3-phosphoshikimate 1-carboxyvinyltransferase [Armatimonadetes bacterium]|nr:3-phosphoshikimate 1-carboxyvinyltransferase [Armatimonadota bacterium]
MKVTPGGPLTGEFTPPGDKSISHRAAMFGAIAQGDTPICGFLQAEDTLNTVRALEQMGVVVERGGAGELLVRGVGLRGLTAPASDLDLGNSGTGMRLLMGILAGQRFAATLTGDESLSRRPMDRIATPLGLMGVRVKGRTERCLPPVTVFGGKPAPVDYSSPVASAQVKSAVLLAGLYADGITTITEPTRSRDHTERMLAAFGADLRVDGLQVALEGSRELTGREVAVPADVSSAAFPLCAALICPDSRITARGVLLNPTRTGLLTVLRRMGARLTISSERDQAGETVGDITAETSELQATDVTGDEIPAMIDEIPLLAAVATRARGTTRIRGAGELRVKESDRLAVMAQVLTSMGARVQELPDGLDITGPIVPSEADIDPRHDHRIAMSAAVLGLVASGPVEITGAEFIATSFPGFAQLMNDLGARLEEVKT